MKLVLLLFLFSQSLWATEPMDLMPICHSQALRLPEIKENDKLKLVCSKVKLQSGCNSVNGAPIFHYDRISSKAQAKKIMVVGLIHGDELPAGTVVQLWMERLEEIDPMSSWRILPVTNPDGLISKSRLNSRGVDLNRNFSTTDWIQSAQKFWKEKTGENPRRFPGDIPASEPEVQCIQKHLDDFQPDFVVAVHTPYAVLDFDGPKLDFPKFLQLPWQSLGNFPGSLGRYMWVDRKVPVLTIELKGQLPTNKEYLLQLQDISSQVARLSQGNRIRVVKPKQAFNE